MSIHYNAFISYKHAELDNKIAAQIERDLERYHIPKKIQKQRASHCEEKFPVTGINISFQICSRRFRF